MSGPPSQRDDPRAPSHVSLACVVAVHEQCVIESGGVTCNCPCHKTAIGAVRDDSAPDQERIVAAAILQGRVVLTGPHHHQIIRYAAPLLGIRPITGEQGFVTSRGRYVDRQNAARIALAAGQIAAGQDALFSEQLWEVPDGTFMGAAPDQEKEKAYRELDEEIYEAIRQRFKSELIQSGPAKGDQWWDWLAVWLRDKVKAEPWRRTADLAAENAALRQDRDRWRAACNSRTAEERIRGLESELSALRQRIGNLVEAAMDYCSNPTKLDLVIRLIAQFK